MTIITPQVAPVYDLGTRADYLSLGVGSKKKGHQRAGTDRLGPGSFCDLPSIDEFIALGNQLAAQNGRKVKAQSYITSGSPDEYDVNNPDDLKRLGDVAYLLMKAMHPDSYVLTVVHPDGGAVHAHSVVLNHNNVTGKALRDFRVHWQVKRANDELMRELGIDVLEAKPKQPTDAWTLRRAELPEFDVQLGDAVAEAKAATLAHAAPSMDIFKSELTARGVEVSEAEHVVKSGVLTGHAKGDVAVGFTFKMRDETVPSRRLRRRKASVLSSEFTHDAIAAEIDAKTRQAATPAPVVTAPPPAPTTEPKDLDGKAQAAPESRQPAFGTSFSNLLRNRQEQPPASEPEHLPDEESPAMPEAAPKPPGASRIPVELRMTKNEARMRQLGLWEDEKAATTGRGLR